MLEQLSAFTLCGQDFDEAVRNISAAGFRNIALYFRPEKMPCQLEDMTDADAESMKRTLADHGLTAIAAGGGSTVLTQEGLDLFLKKLDGAAKLGVPAFDTGSIGTDGKEPDVVERETNAFCEGISKAGDAAAERGIVICLETHGGLTGTVPSCLALMERIDHPNVRIGYDPANIDYYEGASPLDRLDELVPFIGHIHAKDHVGGKRAPDFPALGTGDVPYGEIVPTLLGGGYAGHISVERAPGDTPEERLKALKDAHAFLTNLVTKEGGGS